MNRSLPWALLTLSILFACSDKDSPASSNDLALGGNSNLGDAQGGAAPQGDAAGTRSTQVATGGNTSSSSRLGSSGGTQATGNSTSTSVAFDPAMTAGCPRWPQNRLAPWVGMFFFGPDPGPCSETQVDQNGKVSVSTASYDAQGRVIQMVEPAMTSHYEYVGDRIEKVTFDGADWGLYEYSADSLRFTAGPPSSYVAIWQMDSLGYPRKLLVDFLRFPADPDVVYRYEYENCRIVRRIVESVVEPTTAPDWQYSYDAEGHLAHVTASNGWNATEDYSCWK